MNNARGRSGRLFTLVELLIVIAVIALLTAMLLPALRKAKESGMSVVCMGNLRQIGIVNLQYVEGNNNLQFYYNTNQYRPFVELSPYLNGGLPYWGADNPTMFTTMRTRSTIFSCPSSTSSTIFGQYGWNTMTNSIYALSYVRTWAQLKTPSQTMMWTDCTDEFGGLCGIGYYSFYPTSDLQNNWAGARHSNRANFLWADGHTSATQGVSCAYGCLWRLKDIWAGIYD